MLNFWDFLATKFTETFKYFIQKVKKKTSRISKDARP